MDITKLLLVAGGGYLLYRYLSGNTAGVAAAVVTSPAAAAPAVSTAPPSGASIKALVQAAAQAAGYGGQLLTCDQWQYFYVQVRGVPASIDCGGVGYNRSEKISLDEFWAMGSGAGLNGLGCSRRGSRFAAKKANVTGRGRIGSGGQGNYVLATGERF